MASPNENDDVPMLPISDKSSSSSTRPFTSRPRSISLANTSSTIDEYDNSTVVLGYTSSLGTQRRPPLVQMSDPLSFTRGPQPPFHLPPPPPSGSSSDSVGASSSQPGYLSFATLERKKSDDELVLKQEHLFLGSEKFGMCNEPYFTTCPSYYNPKAIQIPTSRDSVIQDVFHKGMADNAKGRDRRFATSNHRYSPVIMNPHSRYVRSWAKFFSLSCLLSILLDPLFIFLTSVKQNSKCIMIDWPMAYAFVAVRSATDVTFFVNILLQFRLAYVSPDEYEGFQLVDDPRKIARHYFRGKFKLDLFMVLPLSQILILWIMPAQLGFGGINAYILFYAAVVSQYILKLYRITPAEFIFESASKFATNFLTFMLVGHLVGSCWYFLGLQKVKRCLLDACGNSDHACRKLIHCRHGSSDVALIAWIENASACFQEDSFPYGIYLKAVNLTNQASLITRYSYSLFWGIQQISTLAGNQVPSYSLSEIFFTMTIVILGLLLFAFLIGHMQNYLLAAGRRNLEMTVRKHEAEQWMRCRRFPERIRKRIRTAEQFNWFVKRGVNEELLFGSMPHDLQRDIRRYLFTFLKKVRIFSLMDESILDSIREKLERRTYISSSTVFSRGYVVDAMVFIVRGEMESIGADGSVLPLSEGDVCGEEVLTWCLERFSCKPGETETRIKTKGLVSNRNVRCVTNVDAFSLSVADLEEVMSFFSTFIRSHRVQGAIRYESPYWRLRAARQIQVAWRYRRRRLKRLYTAQPSYRR